MLHDQRIFITVVDGVKLVLDEMNMAMKETMKIAKCINAQKPFKGAVNAALSFITTEIETIKANKRGKTPYDALVQIVAANKSVFLWLNFNKITYDLQKLNKMNVLPKSNSEQLLSSLTRLSSITVGTGTTSTGI